MFKFLVALLAALMMACIVSADEFTDRLAKFEASTATLKARCDCSSPADCICGTRDGDCTCGPCKAAKVKAEPKKLPKAPPLAMKHHCGCPSMGCNCAPLGGCHCSENAMFNRVNPMWRREADGTYSLWRGREQIGGLNSSGTYYPLHDGEWCEPCAPPIPLPQHRSELRVAAAPTVCRS